MKVAALVGYTSAGKSSMENALTDAGIPEDAMLFSTLDTTTRVLELEGKQIPPPRRERELPSPVSRADRYRSWASST